MILLINGGPFGSERVKLNNIIVGDNYLTSIQVMYTSFSVLTLKIMTHTAQTMQQAFNLIIVGIQYITTNKITDAIFVVIPLPPCYCYSIIL